MGIEHPILGLMTITIILTALVGAVVFLAIYHYNLQQAILSMPLTVGYSQCYSKTQDGNITGIFVANNHRVDLNLVKMWVGTEQGPIEVPVSGYGTGYKTFDGAEITVWTAGFYEGNKLLQGQPGTVWVLIRSDSPLHVKGKIYSITLYFKVEGLDAFITQEARVKPGETPICIETEIPKPPITLELPDRAPVIYNDTFDTDPFIDRRLEKQHGVCKWRYDSTLRAVSIPTDSRGPPGWGYWCIAYVRVDIKNYVKDGRTVYIAFLAFRSEFAEPTIRVAAIHLNAGVSEFYILGYQVKTLSGRTGDDVKSVIAYYRKDYRSISVLNIGISPILEHWYLSHISTSINFSSWRAVHWVDENLNVAAIPVGLRLDEINRAGIGFWISRATPGGWVYFDNLIVTVDRPPWIVEVRGLSPGWTVTLRNATGYPVATAIAGPDGVARLIVAPPLVDLLVDPSNRNGFIFPNGIIEVYDEHGVLVVRKQFPLIIGGDIYELRRGP